MKPINTILTGGITIASQLAHATNEIAIPLKYLYHYGLNPDAVKEAYLEHAKVELNWEEVLKVSSNEEGSEVNFNTIDGIAIVVPITMASGPFNKGDTTGD